MQVPSSWIIDLYGEPQGVTASLRSEIDYLWIHKVLWYAIRTLKSFVRAYGAQ